MINVRTVFFPLHTLKSEFKILFLFFIFLNKDDRSVFGIKKKNNTFFIYAPKRKNVEFIDFVDH